MCASPSRPARRDGGRAQARSVRRAPRQSAARADLHRQRSDGEQLRAAGMSRLGRARKRLDARARASCRNGKGLGMACSHYISGASKPVNWTGEPHATVKLKLDFDGSIVLLTGAAEIGQGSSTMLVQSVAEVLGPRSVAHPHRQRRQRRGAEGQRLLFLARHLHGRQRRDRCGAKSQKPAWSPRRRVSSTPSRGNRVPGRALPRRRAGQGPDLRGSRHRSAERYRHHHRHRQLFDHPAIARRQEISRRGDRRHHGLQLFGAGR